MSAGVRKDNQDNRQGHVNVERGKLGWRGRTLVWQVKVEKVLRHLLFNQLPPLGPFCASSITLLLRRGPVILILAIKQKLPKKMHYFILTTNYGFIILSNKIKLQIKCNFFNSCIFHNLFSSSYLALFEASFRIFQ